MGCESVHEANNLRVACLRTSMERRWLINAKTNVMRQRKWQEVRVQKELEEQKKKAEVLEKRRRERARLAAYIHSTVQPSVKCGTKSKLQRNDKKRLNWSTCLLQDQELILKLRENAKAVARKCYKRDCSNTGPALQGHYPYSRKESNDLGLPKQLSVISSRAVTRNWNFKMDIRDSDQLLQGPAECAEGVALRSFSKRNDQSSYPGLQVPKTCPAKCEIPFNTSAAWSPNIMTCETKLADDHQNPRTNKPSTCTVDNLWDQCSGSQPGSSVLPNLEEAEPQVMTDVAGSWTQPVEAKREFGASNLTSCEFRECTKKMFGSDLKEEILRSRLVNEAATARLIAEVTAIESRLEDCNLSLKPLDFREARPNFFATAGLTGILDADPVHLEAGLEIADCELSSVSDKEPSQKFTRGTADINIKPEKSNLEKPQTSQKPCMTRMILSTPSAEVLDGIGWDNVIAVCTRPNRPAELRCTDQGKFHMEGSETRQQAFRGRDVLSCPKHEPSNEVNRKSTCSQPTKIADIGITEERKLQLEGLQTFQHLNNRMEILENSNPEPFDETDLRTVAIRPPQAKAPSNDCMKESSAAWGIHWEALRDHLSERKPEYPLSIQSGMSGIVDGKVQYKEHFHHHQVPHCVNKTRLDTDEKLSRFFELGQSTQQGLVRQGDGDNHLSLVEGPTFPCDCLDVSTLQSFQDCILHSPYLENECIPPCEDAFQVTRPRQLAGPEVPPVSHSHHKYEKMGSFGKLFSADKENHFKRQHLGLTEEEQEIFASLERLDWKLAAISTRPMNVGRESMISQVQYSIRSAPAVRGPPPSPVMRHSSISAKKTVPYSTFPSHPLTPQGPKTQRMLMGRQRGLVGVTNKAGKVHHLSPKM